MNAGQLDKRCELQSYSVEYDNYKSPVESAWITYATVWGNIKPLQGQELIAANQVYHEVTHTITIRYRNNVQTKDRILARGRTFHIVGIINIDENDTFLQLTCKEET